MVSKFIIILITRIVKAKMLHCNGMLYVNCTVLRIRVLQFKTFSIVTLFFK